MTELLVRALCGATLGLALVLLLRRPARRVFGAGPAFTLWLLPVALALAPLLPQGWMPVSPVWTLPAVLVTAQSAGIHAASSTSRIDWPQWLMIAWALGTVVGLLRLAIHYVRLMRGMRGMPDMWRQVLHVAAPDLDLNRVRMHAHGPAMLWAVPRSLLLLPPDFAERFGDIATRELVLRHELTHARRGDAWWSLAMEIASALLWFHPLAWLARTRFRLDQELACDAASLRALPTRQAHYARALLDSVAVQPLPALIPWLAEPQLKERIVMITRIPPGTLRRRAGLLMVAVLLAGGLYFSSGMIAARASTKSGSSAWIKAVNDGLAVVSAAPSVDVTYKDHHMPKYPVKAARDGEQGTVILDVTVDAKGGVEKVAVDPKGTTAPAILQTAAVDAAAQWKFHPGMRHGQPVGGMLRIPVNFSLNPSWTKSPSHCPEGFEYKQGPGKSFSCVVASPFVPSPAVSAGSSH